MSSKKEGITEAVVCTVEEAVKSKSHTSTSKSSEKKEETPKEKISTSKSSSLKKECIESLTKNVHEAADE